MSEDRSIIAISFTIYLRNENQKGQLKSCRRVQVCKSCFENLIAEGYIYDVPKSRKLLAAIRESLASRYSAMLFAGGGK